VQVCWVCGDELESGDDALGCRACTGADEPADVGALLDDLLEEPLDALDLS
jgi:hypothetical protein